MRKAYNSYVAEKPTVQPGEERVSSRAPFRSFRDLGPDSFLPKFSALLADRGPMRSAAFRDLGKMASRFGKEELWESAKVLLKIIRDKGDDPFERMEAIETVVSVLNALRGKIANEEKGGETWSAETQVSVQGALPKLHPEAVLHADREEEASEKKKYGKREGLREQALIGALNSVALGEMFDNADIADSIRIAIGKLDSPYAKKLVNRRALDGLVDPLEKRPGIQEEEPLGPTKKKASIEELFGLHPDPETDFSDVG